MSLRPRRQAPTKTALAIDAGYLMTTTTAGPRLPFDENYNHHRRVFDTDAKDNDDAYVNHALIAALEAADAADAKVVWYVRQRQIPLQNLLQHGQVGRFLGEGSSGAAFQFCFDAHTWHAIKLSRTRLLDTDALQKPSSGAATTTTNTTPLVRLIKALPMHATPKEAIDRQDVLADFGGEFANAQQILEAEPFRLHLSSLTPDAQRVGAANSQNEQQQQQQEEEEAWLKASEYFHAIAQQCRRQAHPGFHHMHKVLHYIESLPAIISELADGSLYDLQKRCTEEQNDWLRVQLNRTWLASQAGGSAEEGIMEPPPMWGQIAEQTLLAVAYLEDHTGLAHVDLKPDNIFFHWAGAGAGANDVGVRCCIGDYGLCKPLNEPIPPHGGRGDQTGTKPYDPHAHAQWRSSRVPWSALMHHQTLVTLLDLLLFYDDVGTQRFVNPFSWTETTNNSSKKTDDHDGRDSRNEEFITWQIGQRLRAQSTTTTTPAQNNSWTIAEIYAQLTQAPPDALAGALPRSAALKLLLDFCIPGRYAPAALGALVRERLPPLFHGSHVDAARDARVQQAHMDGITAERDYQRAAQDELLVTTTTTPPPHRGPGSTDPRCR